MKTYHRLRIYISSTDKTEHGLLSEYLVHEAHKNGLAGATVVKGIMGYGASSVIHSYKFWEITDKVPVVVEMLDEEEKILTFYESVRNKLETIQYGCLVTIEPCIVLMAKAGKKRG